MKTTQFTIYFLPYVPFSKTSSSQIQNKLKISKTYLNVIKFSLELKKDVQQECGVAVFSSFIKSLLKLKNIYKE